MVINQQQLRIDKITSTTLTIDIDVDVSTGAGRQVGLCAVHCVATCELTGVRELGIADGQFTFVDKR